MSDATKREIQVVVGRAVREVRLSRRLSQEQLGEAAGIQPETVSRYEAGATAISVPLLFTLADTLDVSVVTLLGMKEGELRPVGPEEDHLLAGWRKLDSEARQAILIMINRLSQ